VLEKFNPKYATKITRDEQRNPRDLIHHEHVPSKAASARGAAREYLHDCYGLIGTKVAELRNLHRRPERSLTKAGIVTASRSMRAAWAIRPRKADC